MASEWVVRRLGDLVEVYDGPHATPEKTTAGPIFLGISNLVGGRLDLSEAEHLSEEDFVRWTRRVTPQAGDVVFSYETRLGEAALIQQGLRCCLGRRMGILRPRNDLVDSRFLLYAYLGTEFQETLRARTIHGSTVDRIPLIDMPDFPIRVPSMDVQVAIANILGALDDKIELNRRMSETLESMARALFKSWFMDFDPVHAKVDRRDTGLPKRIADLFPAAFEDSEMGKVPKGWRIHTVGDICSRIAMGPFGSNIKTDNFVPEGVPVVRGVNLTEGFVDDDFVYLSEAKADELKNANAFPGDIVITHRGTLGQVGLIPRRPRFSRYVVSQSQMVLTVDPARTPPEFAFRFLCSQKGQHQLLANTSQTGVPAIARPTSSVKAIPIVLPPVELLQYFDGVVGHLSERRYLAWKESRTLISLRDQLLPKLISGELRLPAADRIAGRRV